MGIGHKPKRSGSQKHTRETKGIFRASFHDAYKLYYSLSYSWRPCVVCQRTTHTFAHRETETDLSLRHRCLGTLSGAPVVGG